jgi:hypothetical protein
LAQRKKSRSEYPAADDNGEVLQFKIWLKGISPMIWRRVQVVAHSTLRELHGVFQVAMGWEGIHLFEFSLRTVHYGSSELGWRSPNISLDELQIRKGARFSYEYDLNIPWDHEVRLEDRVKPEPGRTCPYCVAGHEPCPPEDCGGPIGFMERRDARYSLEGMDDLAAVADFVDRVVLKKQMEVLKDEAVVAEMRDVLERFEIRNSCFCRVDSQCRDKQTVRKKAADAMEPTRRAPPPASPHPNPRWNLEINVRALVSSAGKRQW